MSDDLREEIQRYDRHSDRCRTCNVKLPPQDDCQNDACRWCSLCWWEFQPSWGSSVTLSIRDRSVAVFIDNVPFQLSVPEAKTWTVVASVTKENGLGTALWVLNGDSNSAVSEYLKDLRPGCVVVVGVWGFHPNSQEPWSQLESIGCPKTVEEGGQTSAFALISVGGKRKGMARWQSGIHCATAGRRICSSGAFAFFPECSCVHTFSFCLACSFNR